MEGPSWGGGIPPASVPHPLLLSAMPSPQAWESWLALALAPRAVLQTLARVLTVLRPGPCRLLHARLWPCDRPTFLASLSRPWGTHTRGVPGPTGGQVMLCGTGRYAMDTVTLP